MTRNDPELFHHVDEATGTRIPHTESPLEKRHRCRALCDDQVHGPTEHLVSVRVQDVLFWFRSNEKFLAQFGPSLRTPVVGNGKDLLLADVGTLKTLEARGTDRAKEHVTVTEEALGTVGVEDDARVNL